MNSSSRRIKISSFWNKCQDIQIHLVQKSNFDTHTLSCDCEDTTFFNTTLSRPSKDIFFLSFFFEDGRQNLAIQCVCVFTSIHLEGFICLGLEVQGTDQRCCVEEVIFLCLVPSSILQYESPSLSN